jgi:hypothetical protein
MNSYLYNLPKYNANIGNPRLLRVIANEDFTRVDFGYQADPIYKHGGWVDIEPLTFIIAKGSEKKLILTKAENIPLSPDKHQLLSEVDNLFFTLYFPPLPKDTTVFDLIEKESSSTTLFNYYSVQLNSVKAIQLP